MTDLTNIKVNNSERTNGDIEVTSRLTLMVIAFTTPTTIMYTLLNASEQNERVSQSVYQNKRQKGET